MAAGDDVTPESVVEEISREILQVQDEAYGEASREAKAYVLDDLALVVIDAEPTTAEKTLIDAGKADAVRNSREAYQEAIGPTFTAIVERATGRRVKSFSSRMSVDPFYAIELFRLEPLGG